MRKIRIAIDGPASAGKSTIAKLLAEKLNIEYIDTGAMYRALTVKALRIKCDLDNSEEVKKLLTSTEIDFISGSIFLDKKNVDEEIRTPEVDSYVSKIASNEQIRDALANMQREIGEHKSVLMDGREIGTNVFPNAEYKFFVTASVEVRADRRYIEMIKKGYSVKLNEIKKEIEDRDKADYERSYKPLLRAEDAILVDTSNKNIDEVLEELSKYIKEK